MDNLHDYTGPALAGAGPNARPRHAALLGSDFYDVIMFRQQCYTIGLSLEGAGGFDPP